MRTINAAGLALTKLSEGILDGDKTTPNYDPYMDVAKYWTIGYGHLIVYNGRKLKGSGDEKLARSLYPNGLNLSQCEALLTTDMMTACRDAEHAVHVTINDNQFAALADWTFQFGAGNLATSTLLRRINGMDFAGAATEFAKWIMADGVRVAGLVTRAERRRVLFTTPE